MSLCDRKSESALNFWVHNIQSITNGKQCYRVEVHFRELFTLEVFDADDLISFKCLYVLFPNVFHLNRYLITTAKRS